MKIKLEHLIEGVGVFIAIALFIYEFKNAGEEGKIILWIVTGSISVLVSILLAVNYFLSRFEQIKNNKRELGKEIKDVKKELNMRLALEEINYKIGRLEPKSKNAKKKTS